MNALMIGFLSVSVSALCMAGVVWLLEKLLKNHLSFRFRYGLWLLVILRLLIPVSPASGLVGTLFSEETWKAQPPISVSESGSDRTALTDQPEIRTSDADVPSLPASPDLQPSVSPSPSLRPLRQPEWFSELIQAAWVLWLSVAVVLCVRRLTSYQSFLRFIQAGSFPASKPETQQCLKEVRQEMNIRRELPVWINKLAVSPMLPGVFRPQIILTSEDCGGDEMRMILRHELTHYRRGDIFTKWLVQLAVCVHWFNPVIRLISRHMESLCELACDEQVLASLSGAEKRCYGDTLIHSLKDKGTYGDIIVSITLNENLSLLKERLSAIMNEKKPGTARTLISMAAGAVLFASGILCGSTLSWKTPTPAAAPVTTTTTSSNQRTFYFSGSVYTQGYIVTLNWSGDRRPEEDSVALDSMISVAFDESMKAVMDNAEQMEAVRQAVLEQHARLVRSNSTLASRTPLLASIEGPYSESPEELAVRFHKEKKMSQFHAVASKLSEASAVELARTFYASKEMDYFAVLVDALPAAEILELSNLAYQNQYEEAFDLLASRLDQDQLQALAAQSYADHRFPYFEILMMHLPDQQCMEWAEKAYTDNRRDYFEEAVGDLMSAQLDQWAERTYSDQQLEFFEVIANSLSSQQRAELAEKAYADNRVDYFEEVFYSLSSELAAAYAQRIVDDQRIQDYLFVFDSDLPGELLDKLAVQAYDEKQMELFNRIQWSLNSQTAKELIQRAYADNRTDVLYRLSSNVDSETLKALAEQAFTDRRHDVFMNLSDELSSEQKAEYAGRAYDDQNLEIMASLIYDLSHDQVLALAQRAYADQKIHYFELMLDELTTHDIDSFKAQAKKDGRDDFYSLLNYY